MADAKTIMTIVAIRKFCIEKKCQAGPVICEFNDPSKIEIPAMLGLGGTEKLNHFISELGNT